MSDFSWTIYKQTNIEFWERLKKHYRLTEQHLKELSQLSQVYLLSDSSQKKIFGMIRNLDELKLDFKTDMQKFYDEFPTAFPNEFDVEGFWKKPKTKK